MITTKAASSIDIFKNPAIPNYAIVNEYGKVKWAYVPDVELLKQTFEKLHPSKELKYIHGPHLYYYRIWTENRKINES